MKGRGLDSLATERRKLALCKEHLSFLGELTPYLPTREQKVGEVN